MPASVCVCPLGVPFLPLPFPPLACAGACVGGSSVFRPLPPGPPPACWVLLPPSLRRAFPPIWVLGVFRHSQGPIRGNVSLVLGCVNVCS